MKLHARIDSLNMLQSDHAKEGKTMTSTDSKERKRIPIMPLLRFLVVGELVVAAIVGLVGYFIFKWPTLWHFGLGMILGGIAVLGFGAYSSMGAETAVRNERAGPRAMRTGDLRALAGVSQEDRDEQDRNNLRSAVSFFWLALILGCLTMTIGVVMMMTFFPGA